MMGLVKKWLLRFASWTNTLLIVLMLLSGYSDRVDPESHPVIAYAGMAFPAFVVANLLMLCFWTLADWRRLWLPVGGLLLAYTPINIYAPVRVIDRQADFDLKVVSYNVGGYCRPAEGSAKFDSVFSYLVRQQPDIVCLQEDNGTWHTTDERCAGHFAHHGRVSLKRGDTKWSNSVAVLSRFPILRSELIDAPTETGVNGAVAFYLGEGNDTLLVVNCHLENVHLNAKDRRQYKEIMKGDVPTDTAQTEGKLLLSKLSGAYQARAAQVKAIARYIGEHRRGHRVIVCGDFNDTPISFARHTLCQGLHDCFAESGCGLGLSYNQKGFNFRIDHILCSTDMTPVRCEVDSKMGQSDHYPVICWLKMGLNP